MAAETVSNFFVHSLLRAHDWQHRPQLDDVCQWWRGGGRGVLALVGMGGAGKTAIVERFLRVLPGGLPPDPDVPKDNTLPTPRGVFVFSFYDAPNPEAFFEALQMWLEHTPRIQVVFSLQQMIFLLQQRPGLMVLDGLEKVQEDGVRGLLGRLASPKLREFLDRIAAGYFPELSVLVTSRFLLADLRDARPQFFRSLPIEEIEVPAGIRLLRARGVNGTNLELERIVEACGRHALTVDFAGGYIAEFGGGDPATPVDFEMDSERLRQRLDDEPDEARRRVLKQGHRFARLAERYREAMRGDTADRSEGDAAALALLERICLFRLGVNAETLANIFTGEKAVNVSGPALAGLSGAQLQKKLDWLVRMRIVESQSATQNPQSKIRYSIHPAVRDGFLSGIGDAALRDNHEAVRQGLEVSLGDAPGENPSDPATLDLLEEIVHHTLQSGHVNEAWDVYWNRIGGFRNLIWRLGAYERGERICRAFAGGRGIGVQPGSAPPSDRQAAAAMALPWQSLPEARQAIFINEWALYLLYLGRLAAAARGYELGTEMAMRQENWANASIGNQNLSDVWLLSGRLTAGQATAAEALRLAELADDAEERYKSHAFRAHAHALRGEVPSALVDFRAALDWQHEAESHAPDRPLWSLRGIWHTHLLARLGRRDEATRLTEANIAIELEIAGVGNPYEPKCNLILSDLHREAGDIAQAETLHASAHDWAVARDAKEVLCWAALVEAQIAARRVRNRQATPSSIPPSAIPNPPSALADGLALARDCGYGIFHIDLLLERARLHLLSGAPQAALDDLRTALDDGVPGNSQTGQPELLAATHAECGYAWGIAEGLQLRSEALLLQAAQAHGQSTFAPAQRATLPAAVRDLIAQAEACLTEALARWQPLHDPEPERPDQNFHLDGKEYNYRAAETHRILTELAGGVLTNYPLTTAKTQNMLTAPETQSHPLVEPQPTLKLKETQMKNQKIADIKGHVDFAIITIREDEFEAALARFPNRTTVDDGKQIYEYCRFKNHNGTEFGVAIVRTHSQGQTAAQSVTRDAIADLKPRWLILAGIAGAPPDNDFSLGDVCLATRLNDFSVSAALEGKAPVFQQGGGDMHPAIQRLLAWLPAARERLGDWNSATSLRCEKPKVIVPKGTSAKTLYGNAATKRAIRDSLARHFNQDGSSREPRFHIGPGATANVLVKDTTLLQRWQESARHLTHVEMEAGGVFEAARHGGSQEIPLLCVRGISDIVGFKRSPEWTAFACHSAAAFVHALLTYAPLNPR